MSAARAHALAALLAAVLLAGCDGAGGTPAEPPPPGTGYFVGDAGGDGIGAAVDFHGADRTAAAVRRAVRRGGGGHVAIASIVNDGSAAVPLPRFTAEAPDGRRVPLVPAREALAGRRDGAARRALALLPPLRRAIPGEDSVVVYLVLRGPAPDALRSLLARPAAGAPVQLLPRPR